VGAEDGDDGNLDCGGQLAGKKARLLGQAAAI